ncbi:MAG: rod shape-determining protein MreD [Bacteroidetes bacterium]|nr:rod shape-determining protein MreD [Bacteroidota bacterium]MBU1116293.1 rod shape-determining protein MreD [Bacteroidota bacterium]MBU1797141.1 rod shape-determining protein MreD [Bacteroidota bacterium]
MINKIVFPILIALVLLPIQLVVIPLISISNIIPNIVLIYVLLYSFRYGQIAGTIFAFFIGILYDTASSSLLGSGMFSFTLAAFIAGYFYKEDFKDILLNIHIFIFALLLSSFIFFLFYSVLGTEGIIVESNFSFITFALFSSVYNIIFALSLYLIPRNKL